MTGVLAFIILFLDQASKIWVSRVLLSDCQVVVSAYRESRVMLPCNQWIEILPVLNFRFHLNPGISFSWFSGGGEWGRLILIAIAAVMIIFMIWYLMKETRVWVCMGTGLVIGGAIGNVIDRIYVGAVIDFIDFHIGSWHPFIFNLADAAISTGVFCLLIDVFLCQFKVDKERR